MLKVCGRRRDRDQKYKGEDLYESSCALRVDVRVCGGGEGRVVMSSG